MRIRLVSVPVTDQQQALDFYCDILEFDDTCGNLIQLYEAGTS
jgi:catechol 2,3-dioxygenase-like lactoylglutathione lyase family enzyme